MNLSHFQMLHHFIVKKHTQIVFIHHMQHVCKTLYLSIDREHK